jgi:hypothetical protein
MKTVFLEPGAILKKYSSHKMALVSHFLGTEKGEGKIVLQDKCGTRAICSDKHK